MPWCVSVASTNSKHRIYTYKVPHLIFINYFCFIYLQLVLHYFLLFTIFFLLFLGLSFHISNYVSLFTFVFCFYFESYRVNFYHIVNKVFFLTDLNQIQISLTFVILWRTNKSWKICLWLNHLSSSMTFLFSTLDTPYTYTLLPITGQFYFL